MFTMFCVCITKTVEIYGVKFLTWKSVSVKLDKYYVCLLVLPFLCICVFVIVFVAFYHHRFSSPLVFCVFVVVLI